MNSSAPTEMPGDAAASDSRSGSPRRVRVRWVLLAFACAIGVLVTDRALMNFHAVTDGVVYRSAQLSPRELADVVRGHGIRSILNLRGASDGEWYADEVAAAKALGVAHYDYKLSARREVTPQQLDEIVALMATAPKPLLLHCQAGADRASLVSAVWKLRAENVSPEEAQEQMSVLYFHFPYLLWKKYEAMDISFERYVHNHRQAEADGLTRRPLEVRAVEAAAQP